MRYLIRSAMLILTISPIARGATAPPWLIAISSGPKLQYQESLQTPNLVTHRMSEFRDQILVINFWATWCGFCRSEAPALERFYEKVHGQGVDVLRVSMEPSAVVKNWLMKNFINLPIYSAPSLSPAEMPVTGFPTTYVIGRNGQVLYVHNGVGRWDDPEVANFLLELARAPSGG
jgi:thiol-disulfide isomerase/thioredoxin